MKEPETLSLNTLPDSIFGKLQITRYEDGCLVFSIIKDEETKCAVTGGIAKYGKVLTAGLTKKNSDTLIEFVKKH